MPSEMQTTVEMPDSAPSADVGPQARPPTAVETFEAQRRMLFAIAYRMLGSAREAEDLLQDAYIRWHGVDHSAVQNPGAYLARLVTHLSINALKSAHRRRVEYVGPWLPEPLVKDDSVEQTNAEEMSELADELSVAFLLLLERLTPVERAIFLLRESFDFSYAEIAGIVGKTEANCRQIERRARKHLAERGTPRRADPAEHERLLVSFLMATRDGNVDQLVSLLAEDAVTYSDGGGKATAARNPVRGATNVARLFVGLAKKGAAAAAGPVEFRLARVNGETGLLTFVGGVLRNVVTIEVRDGRIANVFVLVNPDKLPDIKPAN